MHMSTFSQGPDPESGVGINPFHIPALCSFVQLLSGSAHLPAAEGLFLGEDALCLRAALRD